MINHTLCFANPLSRDSNCILFALVQLRQLVIPIGATSSMWLHVFCESNFFSTLSAIGGSACRKTQRSQGGFGPLEFQAWPAACTTTTGADSFREKSREGGRGRGACFPVHQLVKMIFLTSCIPSSMGYRLFGFHQKAGTPRFAALRLCLLPTRSPWAACNRDMARNPTPTQNSA